VKIFFLAAIAATMVAFAGNAGESGSKADVIRDHMRWIAVQNPSYDGNARLPAVRLVPRKNLFAMAYEKDIAEVTDAAEGVILGVYDSDSETVYLPEGFSFSDPKAAHVLVHELVHHLQNVAGVTDPTCPEQGEWEAYKIESAFQQERGQEVDPNLLIVAAGLSMCHDD